MTPIRFRIRTIMIVIAASAVFVTICRYHGHFVGTLIFIVAWLAILVVTIILSIKLLAYLAAYLLRPMRKHLARQSHARNRPESGEAERV